MLLNKGTTNDSPGAEVEQGLESLEPLDSQTTTVHIHSCTSSVCIYMYASISLVKPALCGLVTNRSVDLDGTHGLLSGPQDQSEQIVPWDGAGGEGGILLLSGRAS